MRKARHIDIFNRLEATKQHGLLTDFRIEWRANSFSAPRITVRGRSAFPAQITRNYVTALLGGFVPSSAIDVVAD